MDRYLNKRPQILKQNFTELGQCVCIIGKSGIGKTWAVNHAFGGYYIELTSEILKSKQGTIEFLERIEHSNSPVVLDEYETLSDMIGIREILKPPTKNYFIIISQIPLEHKFPFEIKTYEFPVPTIESMKALFPWATESILQESRGDLRYVIRGQTFETDKPDEFKSPREFVTDLVSKYTKVNPIKYIGHPVQEPGNMVSILQENYLDAKGVDLVEITSMLSDANLIENKMYEDGQWHLMHYYNLMGCIGPAMAIGHRLDPDKMRPGQLWTKHQNMCMRAKKLSSFSCRISNVKFDNQALLLLRDYAEKGNMELMKEYKFDAKDIDVLNHISPLRKLGPKLVAAIKKAL
jgi:hypothetical protein